MSLNFYLFLVMSALLYTVRGRPSDTTIHLFTSSTCTGSHMSCGNIPSNGCCTTGGDLFASAFLVARESASVTVFAEIHCSGFAKSGIQFKCVQPSFAFSASHWSPSRSKRNETENLTDFSLCRRPDTITLVDKDGKEIKIKIPEGEHTEYEHEFAMGNYATLMEMANIHLSLQF